MRRGFLLAAGIILAGCSPSGVEPALKFENAWVRAAPPGTEVTAGFGRLLNRSDVPLEITAYASPSYLAVSLYQTVLEDGVSRMREVPVLIIPPGGEVELAPGGYHLMLMNPTQASPPHERLVLHIEAAAGQRYSFELPVERR